MPCIYFTLSKNIALMKAPSNRFLLGAFWPSTLTKCPAEANIFLLHLFFLIQSKMSLRKESQREHEPGLPVQSGEIKISKCSLRKCVNLLDCGFCQGPLQVIR